MVHELKPLDLEGAKIPKEWEAMSLAELFAADAHLYDEDEDVK